MSHRGTATKCAKEQVRMASPVEREMLEIIMRRGAEDPDLLTGQQPPRIEKPRPNPPKE